MIHEVVINVGKKLPKAPEQAILKRGIDEFPYSPIGAWGKVLARHSDDNTVDVELTTGFYIGNVPVASKKWATADTPILGERDLPPVGTMVFLLMPTGETNSAFVLTSLLNSLSEGQKSNFLVKDKEAESLSLIEGGWKKTYDKVKGDLQVEDGASFILIVKKSEKKVDLTDWNGNKVVIDVTGAKITDKNSNEITMDGSGIVVKDKNGNKVELTSLGATITTVQGKITGGTLEVNGSAAPTGAGPFCAVQFCPVVGVPHVGSTVVGT